jgi:acyl dehydratase
VSIPIAREAPHVYTECADIWNPIHTERQVALAAGLPDIILHGTATWALAAREIVRHRCNGDPLRLRRLHGRFAAMVIPGSDIEVEIGEAVAHAGGEGCDAIRFGVRNAAGELAVAEGVALLA